MSQFREVAESIMLSPASGIQSSAKRAAARSTPAEGQCNESVPQGGVMNHGAGIVKHNRFSYAGEANLDERS
jgi:hypothetical protein